jgi:hypothetical protein
MPTGRYEAEDDDEWDRVGEGEEVRRAMESGGLCREAGLRRGVEELRVGEEVEAGRGG